MGIRDAILSKKYKVGDMKMTQEYFEDLIFAASIVEQRNIEVNSKYAFQKGKTVYLKQKDRLIKVIDKDKYFFDKENQIDVCAWNEENVMKIVNAKNAE